MENINLEQEFEELWSRTPKSLIGNFLWASRYLKPLAKWFWIEGRLTGTNEARSSFKSAIEKVSSVGRSLEK